LGFAHFFFWSVLSACKIMCSKIHCEVLFLKFKVCVFTFAFVFVFVFVSVDVYLYSKCVCASLCINFRYYLWLSILFIRFYLFVSVFVWPNWFQFQLLGYIYYPLKCVWNCGYQYHQLGIFMCCIRFFFILFFIFLFYLETDLMLINMSLWKSLKVDTGKKIF
jgi:hypothetical protein